MTFTQVIYPESDGLPMAENTELFDWIVYIKEGLECLFANDMNVFVAGDLLWYPVQDHNEIVQAPDTLVAFGTHKGRRVSYKQWEENNIAPQVVFEVRSPSNSKANLETVKQFYENYGVEEYYLYDPARGILNGYMRNGLRFTEIENMRGWISPRLGVRFDLIGKVLQMIRPDGRPFQSFLDTFQRADLAEQQVEQERQAKERAEALLAAERQSKEQSEALLAAERQRAEQAEQRAAALIEQLRALGFDLENL